MKNEFDFAWGGAAAVYFEGTDGRSYSDDGQTVAVTVDDISAD